MLTLVLALAAQTAAPASTTTTEAAPSAATTTDPVAALGATLAALRADVDAAAAAVADSRRAADDDIAALERRRRDLEARLAQSELLTRELAARDAALQSATHDAARAADAARAPVVLALVALRAHVARMPFRAHSRRERIDAAERAIAERSPADAAALVWPLVVDEVALLEATARARQPIEVDGQPLVAEVAHVGPLVFWKTKDGRTGVAVPTDDDARFVEVDDAEGRQRLLLFFDALRRASPASTPRGVFVVPNPLAPAAPAGAVAGDHR